MSIIHKFLNEIFLPGDAAPFEKSLFWIFRIDPHSSSFIFQAIDQMLEPRWSLEMEEVRWQMEFIMTGIKAIELLLVLLLLLLTLTRKCPTITKPYLDRIKKVRSYRLIDPKMFAGHDIIIKTLFNFTFSILLEHLFFSINLTCP